MVYCVKPQMTKQLFYRWKCRMWLCCEGLADNKFLWSFINRFNPVNFHISTSAVKLDQPTTIITTIYALRNAEIYVPILLYFLIHFFVYKLVKAQSVTDKRILFTENCSQLRQKRLPSSILLNGNCFRCSVS